MTGELHTGLGSDGLRPRVLARRAEHGSRWSILTANVRRADRTGVHGAARDAGRSTRSSAAGRTSASAWQLLSHIGAGGKSHPHPRRPATSARRMLTPDRGWAILDFEGEPARPLPERRRKRSPLRDVAGMLRSFAYAAAAARVQHGSRRRRAGRSAPARPSSRGYHEPRRLGAAAAGPAGDRQLLAVFELEKAVYELRYELNNRPDWVGDPGGRDQAAARVRAVILYTCFVGTSFGGLPGPVAHPCGPRPRHSTTPATSTSSVRSRAARACPGPGPRGRATRRPGTA